MPKKQVSDEEAELLAMLKGNFNVQRVQAASTKTYLTKVIITYTLCSKGLGSKIDYSGGDDTGAAPAEPTPPPAKPAPKKAAPRKPPPPPPKPEPTAEEPAEEPIGSGGAPSAFGGPSIGDDAPTKGAKNISDEEAELVRAHMLTSGVRYH